jgi:hypothetical protein
MSGCIEDFKRLRHFLCPGLVSQIEEIDGNCFAEKKSKPSLSAFQFAKFFGSAPLSATLSPLRSFGSFQSDFSCQVRKLQSDLRKQEAYGGTM